MSKHTNGPLRIKRVGDDFYIEKIIDMGIEPKIVAMVKSESDANLFAAAPDLLAALKAYRTAQPQCGCTDVVGCGMAHARKMADDAISKAESP